MTQERIAEGFEYVKAAAGQRIPGNIINKAHAFVFLLNTQYRWPYEEAQLFANLLIQSGYVDYDGMWLKQNDKGFAFVNGEIDGVLEPDLKKFAVDSDAKKNFYIIWNIIGGGNETSNPLYISGPEFYDSIKPFVAGLPPTYSLYIADLKATGKPQTRSVWCKELFLQLKPEDVNNFLDSLSHILSLKAKIRKESEEKPEDNFDDLFNKITAKLSQPIVPPTSIPPLSNQLSMTQPKAVNAIPKETDNNNSTTMSATKKQPKIFISHNTLDKEYAERLIDLLRDLGVRKEDIFCSSCPGYGVPFGQSFLDAIKQQYDNFELLMLFIHSPRYYQSPVSLCEMGAAWITKTGYRSFLTNDCDFGQLRGVIPSTELAFKAGVNNNRHLLNEFKDQVEKFFNITPEEDLNEWERIRNRFIKDVAAIKVV